MGSRGGHTTLLGKGAHLQIIWSWGPIPWIGQDFHSSLDKGPVALKIP
jgi:hypothetical protein